MRRAHSGLGEPFATIAGQHENPDRNHRYFRKVLKGGGMLAYFSEGIGLNFLIVVVAVILIGVGVYIHRSEKKKYFGNILLPSALIGLSIVFLAITFSFPEEEAGPDAVPHLWIFWTILLCSGILFQVYRGIIDPDPESGRIGFLLLVMVILVGYYFAMKTIGYFLSSFLFLVVLMHVLSYKRKLIIYLVSSGWVLFSYIVFYKLLFIQLPLGYFEYFY